MEDKVKAEEFNLILLEIRKIVKRHVWTEEVVNKLAFELATFTQQKMDETENHVLDNS